MNVGCPAQYGFQLWLHDFFSSVEKRLDGGCGKGFNGVELCLMAGLRSALVAGGFCHRGLRFLFSLSARRLVGCAGALLCVMARFDTRMAWVNPLQGPHRHSSSSKMRLFNPGCYCVSGPG